MINTSENMLNRTLLLISIISDEPVTFVTSFITFVFFAQILPGTASPKTMKQAHVLEHSQHSQGGTKKLLPQIQSSYSRIKKTPKRHLNNQKRHHIQPKRRQRSLKRSLRRLKRSLKKQLKRSLKKQPKRHLNNQKGVFYDLFQR